MNKIIVEGLSDGSSGPVDIVLDYDIETKLIGMTVGEVGFARISMFEKDLLLAIRQLTAMD